MKRRARPKQPLTQAHPLIGLHCIVVQPEGEALPLDALEWCDADGVDDVYYLTAQGTLRVGRGTLLLKRESMGDFGTVVLQWRGRLWSMPDELLAVRGLHQVMAQDGTMQVVEGVQNAMGAASARVLHPLHASRIEGESDTDAATRLRMMQVGALHAAECLLLMREHLRLTLAPAERTIQTPSPAGMLSGYAQVGAVGRTLTRHGAQLDAAVVRIIEQGITVTGGEAPFPPLPHGTGEERTPVIVTLEYRYSESSAAQVRVHTDRLPADCVKEMRKLIGQLRQPLLPCFQAKGELHDLYMVAMCHTAVVLRGTRIMWLHVLLGIIKDVDSVRLTPEGEIPDWVRLRLMEETGCPSATANDTQRAQYRAFLAVVLALDLMVKPDDVKRRKKHSDALGEKLRVPLLVATSYRVRDDAVHEVHVNPRVAKRWMHIPEVLPRLTDRHDPIGLLRNMGWQVCARMQLAAARGLPKPERLDKFLERAGVLMWLSEIVTKQGKDAAKQKLDDALSALQALPNRHGTTTDVIGSVSIQWGTGKQWLAKARLHYHAAPRWWQRMTQAQASLPEQPAHALPEQPAPALP